MRTLVLLYGQQRLFCKVRQHPTPTCSTPADVVWVHSLFQVVVAPYFEACRRGGAGGWGGSFQHFTSGWHADRQGVSHTEGVTNWFGHRQSYLKQHSQLEVVDRVT